MAEKDETKTEQEIALDQIQIDEAAEAEAKAKAEEAGEGTGEGNKGGDEKGAPPDPTEVEEIATKMGWAPEDKWRGDPNEWIDAEAFILAGHRMHSKTLKRQDARIAEMDDTLARMLKAQNDVEKRAYGQALADLKAEQRTAVEEGDTEKFDAAGEKIDDLAKTAPAKTAGEKTAGKKPEDAPEFKTFRADNSWYDEDIEMTAYAEQIAPVVNRKYQGEAFYEQISTEVRKKFPENFGNKSRREPARVESGGGGRRRGGGSKGKSYNDLPAEAKAACDGFVEQGTSTRESYCKTYFAEEAAA